MGDHLMGSSTDAKRGVVSTILNQLQYGLGYSAYQKRDQMRKDDQLIRNRACSIIMDAKSILQDKASAWRRVNIVCTPEQPVPSAESLAIAKSMDSVIQSLADMEVRIRNAAMPADSEEKLSHCRESSYLPLMQMHDSELLQSVTAIQSLVESDDCDPSKQEDFNRLLNAVNKSLRTRQETFSGFIHV